MKHCDAFFRWLRANGITVKTHEIVQAVAEKTDCSYPGERPALAAKSVVAGAFTALVRSLG